MPADPRLLRSLRQRTLAILIVAGPATGCTLLIDNVLAGKPSGMGGGSMGGASGHGGGSKSTATSSTGGGSTTTSSTGTGGGSTASSSTGLGGGSTTTSSTGGTGGSTSTSSSGTGPTCDAGCTLPNAKATCSAGFCAIVSCAKNFADCDMMPGDGCEANLKTDDLHCGSCATECAAGHTCSGGKCQ